MKPILTPCLLLSLLLFTLQSYAQSEEDYQYEYDHTYEYNHEYHHEWGMWGYRHEAKLLDSLSVLEMMDSLSRQQVAYQWEDFQGKKQKARKEKKEKDKKDKKDKGVKGGKGKTEKGKGVKGGKGVGYEGVKGGRGEGRTETGEGKTENGEGGTEEEGGSRETGSLWLPRAPLEASLTAGVGGMAPLRMMNQVPDAEERSALMAIYEQMNGANWTYQDNWGSQEPLATWAGITVEDGDVVALELRRNNLTGGVPLTIGKLLALEYLNLGGNAITSLPQQIEGLTKLKALYLDECGLANLPPGLGKLSQLETLNLNYNQLSSLPSTIGGLDQLTRLLLYGNTLLTTLPPQIGGLSALENLYL